MRFLIVEPDARTVGNSNDTAYFDITATGAWTISENVDWFDVSPMSGSDGGTAFVHYEGGAQEAREGVFVVEAPDHTPESVNVKVSQVVAPPLKVEPDRRVIPYDYATTQFTVFASGEWTAIEDVAWFGVYPTSGSGAGTLTVSFDRNQGEERSGSVTVNAPGHYPSSTFVIVIQEKKPEVLEVSPTERYVDYDSEGTGFTIKAKGVWSVQNNSGWFTITPISGEGEDYIRVLYSQNIGPQRRGTLTVTAPGHRPESVTAEVIQGSSPNAPPGKPENFHAENIYWDGVDFKWDDRSDNELGFTVMRKKESEGIWREQVNLNANREEYTDSNLEPLSKYFYEIFAYNAFGESDPSQTIEILTHSRVVNVDPAGGEYEGNIELAGDKDWYSLTLAETDGYTFEVRNNTLPQSNLWLYGPGDRSREREQATQTDEGCNLTVSIPSGTFHIKAGGDNDRQLGTYTLIVTRN